MTPLAVRLDAAYRARIRALRSTATRRIETEWGALTIDQLDERFPGFVERAAKALVAAQVQGVIATRAYLRGMVRAEAREAFELAPRTEVVGTSETGTISEGMAPIRSMVFGKLGESKDPDAAMAMGLYLVGRFADNEVTRAVDTEMTAQATAEGSPVKGWVGTVYGSTDACTGNAGFHTFDEPMYRHPGCKCDRSVAFGEIA
jgi:hypothetical protein